MKSSILIFLVVFSSLASAGQGQDPQLENYPVSKAYIGKPAKVVLSIADEKLFGTRLREASKQPANFAGEYVLTEWGFAVLAA
ncbi:hypothetical protein [Candidatus Methylomicrobium oryzae]|uniref:hypothetical protein n=1 Tax=Candidatus Methylomicrobium oryzae TaxID=2802053 RepID=UPI0019222C97|nr:hypothetical protein [Methylomicrobium sp. RS1]MBL1264924.1 hypothetical protein [Methylomicrobium sp. RS1]